MALLDEDLPLAADAPGGMVCSRHLYVTKSTLPQVEYRRTLAASFFQKFALVVNQQLGRPVDAAHLSAIVRPPRY